MSNQTSYVTESPGRYQRLDEVDRQSAETLNEFFRSNSNDSEIAIRLANLSAWQSFVMAVPLAAADAFSVYGCLMATTALAASVFGINPHDAASQLILIASLAMIPISHTAGLYPGLGHSAVMEFRQTFRALFATLLVFGCVGWFCFPPSDGYYPIIAMGAFALAIPTVATSRFIARNTARYFPFWGVKTLIVAKPSRGLELYKRMQSKPDQGFRPQGVLLDPDEYWEGGKYLESNQVPAFDIRSTSSVAAKLGVTWAIVSPCSNRTASPALDATFAAIPNRIMLASSKLDMGIWDQLFCVGVRTGLRLGGAKPTSFQLFLKRSLDLSLTFCVLLFGSPILALFCFLIKLSSRGPIFYGQKRVGRNGQEFTAWKFRSMVQSADKVLDRYLQQTPEAMAEWREKHKLSKDPRVTQIGAFLRKTSMDELPQLWNVIRGEMSLVGPRPIIDSATYDAEYVCEYPNEYAVYKTVRPGMTGLWQVSSRSEGVYELRVYWDMFYIRNWCIWLDLYLIMRTIKTVIFREGAK